MIDLEEMAGRVEDARSRSIGERHGWLSGAAWRGYSPVESHQVLVAPGELEALVAAVRAAQAVAEGENGDCTFACEDACEFCDLTRALEPFKARESA